MTKDRTCKRCERTLALEAFSPGKAVCRACRREQYRQQYRQREPVDPPDPVPGETKRCSTCERDLPLKVDHFEWHRTQGRWLSQCRECRREQYRQQYRQREPVDPPDPVPGETKRCTKCGVEKQLDVEHYRWHRTHGRWRSRCRECEREPVDPPDPVPGETKRCTKCGVEKQLDVEHYRWLRTLGCWHSRCRDCHSTYVRTDLRTRPAYRLAEKIRASHRRALKLKATPRWLTPDQRQEIADLYELAAHLIETTSVEYHVDHIMPLKGKNLCGLHVPWNLQVLTGSENCSKSNRWRPEDSLAPTPYNAKAIALLEAEAEARREPDRTRYL